jgi:hypothetical protein
MKRLECGIAACALLVVSASAICANAPNESVQQKPITIHVLSAITERYRVTVVACGDDLAAYELACNAKESDCKVIPPGQYELEFLSDRDSRAKYEGQNVSLRLAKYSALVFWLRQTLGNASQCQSPK